MCIVASCVNENEADTMELSYVDKPISSPSGNYEAVIEKFDDNGVRSYRLYIADVNNTDTRYEAELVFRARDKNYVFWADEEDILWGYSGDVGTFFWVIEDGSWVKKSYADNPGAKVPQALKEARPKMHSNA